MRYRILLLSLLSVLSSSATTILIDFGTTLTTGGPPTWNNFSDISGATTYALSDTTGAATGYSIAVSGNLNVLTDNPTTSLANTYSPFTPATVIQDSIFQSTGRVFMLSGLNPSVSYTLTFFSYVNRDTPRDTRIIIPGQTTQVLHSAGDPTAALNSGGDVGTFSNVTPNGSGNIAITIENVNANWILNGMEITYTIPEPATALLIAPAALLSIRRRRNVR